MALVNYESNLREWENIIRVQLKVTNPTLIKSGALGVLTNYLAGIKYDALQFYTKVFQELNVGLAQNFDSMMFHGGIYGIDVQFARPATLSSSLIIPQVNVRYNTTLTFHIPRFTQFKDKNGIYYTVVSDLTINLEKTGTTNTVEAYAWNPMEGSKKLAITSAPNPNSPNSNVFLIHNAEIQQYKRSFYSFEVPPNLPIGSPYPFNIGIDDVTTLFETYVWVNTGKDQVNIEDLYNYDPEHIEEILNDTGPGGKYEGKDFIVKRYNLRFYKYGSSLKDEDIFLTISDSSLNFETGDGVHGVRIPDNSQIIVEVDFTLGIKGNIPNTEFIIPSVPVIEKAEGNVAREFFTKINGISTNGATGGKNVESVNDIKHTIFNKINVRKSIITENDYERVFTFNGVKPFVDAKFVNAKSFVFLFNVIKYNDHVVKSTAVNFDEEVLMSDPFYPEINYGGYKLVSPFYYKKASDNVVDAYLLNPQVLFNLEVDTNVTSANDYSNDKAMVAKQRMTLALMYDFNNRKSYLKIIEGANPGNIYTFTCTISDPLYTNLRTLTCTLEYDADYGDFVYVIPLTYTDDYCVVRGVMTDIKMRSSWVDSNTTNFVKFKTPKNQQYYQLIKKQEFYTYFTEAPAASLPVNLVEQGIIPYVDNMIGDTMSTGSDLLSTPNGLAYKTFLLRLPFIDRDYFYRLNADEVFEMFDQYFVADYAEEFINYNTLLTQTFHNTIDIPPNYFNYLFRENDMGYFNSPELPIEIDIVIDQQQFKTSKYQTQFDLEIAIKLVTINFLKQLEGFQIQFYETDLEKEIYNNFNPIIRNIRVTSPLSFTVDNPGQIYKKLQANLDFLEVLDFIPPYFYYDYKNIKLNIRT